ncbi:acyl-CoA thioesterase [Knoellia sinensis KCTC 19936]|uniref:Acyl-CoA thioesterase 2 n=1 Tax=Knoellia sinensis KCTC 19936 TaxID=1385520 RepID=A0A0A0JGL8_9MICO|nr:acyl-CoA thioesterase II [Knoellia sinensis]KGN34771.1 acyl-CoA thioesterase [Knoellia sinensis KCTC 19936]
MVTPVSDPAPNALADLLAVLDLEEIGTADVDVSTASVEHTGDDRGASPVRFAEEMTLFLGQSQKMPHGRVFGGQVLAQGVMACGLTVHPDEDSVPRPIHSLHAYFMRPGDDTQPITFAVERMRDGRSFSTRRAHAIQNGKPILSMSCSFQEAAEGLDHQDEMPDVPGPDGLQSLADVFGGVDHPGAQHLARRPIEQRHVEGQIFLAPGDEKVARQGVWTRATGPLPDDPLLHAAVLAYASDYALLEPVLRRHGRQWVGGGLNVASLDHAMWFHRPARADEWWLYAQQSPSAQGGRGLGLGRMFTRDGTLVASVAQEGMLRVRGDAP